MGKKTKTGKGRLDKFYHLAKEQGFRARSAFKLTQLSKQFNLFDRTHVCVDLCGAPGGWSQVAVQAMPKGSKVICVDLVPIKAIRGVVTIQSDITTQVCRNLIKSEFGGKSHACDIVLNDGAPNVGSAWSKDAYNQAELTLSAFQLACDLLRPGGTFVTKVFRSADYNSLLWTFQQLFTKVESTKPSASRAVSAEIFVVCQGFKAPTKIDPRFFSPKFVFMNEEADNDEVDADDDEATSKPTGKAIAEKPSSLSGLLKSMGKRNRGGYTLGDDFRTVTVDEFLASKNPAELLIKCHKIIVVPSSTSVVEEPFLSYFQDIKVLGKGELYSIMKWRLKMLNNLSKKTKSGETTEAGSDKHDGSDNDGSASDASDASVSSTDSLTRVTKSRMADERREQKRLRAKEKKTLMRKKMSMSFAGIAETTSASFEQDLFHLPNIKEKAAIVSANMESADYVPEEESAVDRFTVHNPEYQLVRSDDPDRLAQYEADFEEEFQMLKDHGRSGASTVAGPTKGKKVTRRQQHLAKWAADVNALGDEMDKQINDIYSAKKSDDAMSSDDDNSDEGEVDMTQYDQDEEDDDEDESRPTRSTRSTEDVSQNLTSSLVASRWFSNPIFDDSNITELAESDLPIIPMSEKQEKKRKRAEKAARGKDAGDVEDNSIEVVPATMRESAAPSLDEIAQVQALGSLMVRKKSRMAVIESGFNRNSRNEEPNSLPDWFVDEEKRFNQKQLPLTKELMQQYRAKIREINARPIRKEAEAVGRRRRRVQKKLDGFRKMANSLVVDDDEPGVGNGGSIHKAKQIAKGINAIKKDGKRKTVFLAVQRKGASSKQVGGEGGRGAKVAMVDRRLKKDRRGERNATRRNKGRR